MTVASACFSGFAFGAVNSPAESVNPQVGAGQPLSKVESGTQPLLIFNQPEQRAPSDHLTHLVIQPLWQRVLLAEQKQPSFTEKTGNFNRIDAESWRNLVKYSKNMSEIEILHMVNGYFNQWIPKSDDVAWATPEYWDTPAEFINNRGGDCEDYAIAKYFALRFLGFNASRMRIVIVRLWKADGKAMPQLHAVLAVHCKNTWFILDNNARPRDNISPHTQYRGRFEALYSINETGAWLHGAEIEKSSIARKKNDPPQ
jgi:predicted transglutaminase-like cysteine proteinase